MNTAPVAIIIFNRPDKTTRLLDALRVARPPRLLVVGDGPRAHVAEDAPRVLACRDLISTIDWPCRVEAHFAQENMGCRARVASGLDWVFERAERAIILEDDCIPDASFFPFCGELLDRYDRDPRVMSISGGHLRDGRLFRESYSFSRYVRIWGWATWRRAWRLYDVSLSKWRDEPDRPGLATSLFSDPRVGRAWSRNFDRILAGFDTWDYQWTFAHLVHGGLSIVPTVNLTTNIGFDSSATHTRRPSLLENVQTARMDSPLIHPQQVVENRTLDALLERTQIVPSFPRRLFNLVRAGVRRALRP